MRPGNEAAGDFNLYARKIISVSLVPPVGMEDLGCFGGTTKIASAVALLGGTPPAKPEVTVQFREGDKPWGLSIPLEPGPDGCRTASLSYAAKILEDGTCQTLALLKVSYDVDKTHYFYSDETPRPCPEIVSLPLMKSEPGKVFLPKNLMK
jgi:hypothetical protein